MKLNRNFENFKFQHKRNENQIIYTSKKIVDDQEILNLIDNFLKEKNSFIFESVEKGKIRGRYTIFGKNPDKVWEFNNNNSYLIKNKTKKKIRGKPDKVIVQLTGLHRIFYHVKNVPICDLVKHKKFYYYYDTYNAAYREAGISMTPSIVTNSRQLHLLQKIYGIRKKDITTYWKHFASDDNLEWLNLKECMLIDMYFKDTVFFTWHHKFNWLSKYVRKRLDYVC